MTAFDEWASNSQAYYEELRNTLIKKQRDYGPHAISNAPGGALNGIRVRMHDKMSRANNLIDNSVVSPENEPLIDAFADLANYAIIAMMVLRKEWASDFQED